MFRWFIAIAFVIPVAAAAASEEDLDALHAALDTDALMVILSEEGIDQSNELREDMFPGRGGVGWNAVVGRIYDADRLYATFRDAFDSALTDADITPLLDFYRSDTGSRVARVEIEARRAIMSDDVEEAARNAYADLRDSNPSRVALLEEFADLNQLIDRNVAGALNANLAFYRGLGSAEGFTMTENQMLSEVWSREAEIREDTEGWVFGYMTFAYETLSDDDIRAYIYVTGTDAGRDLNRALFAGFDAVFLGVSYDMGKATSQFSVGDEL